MKEIKQTITINKSAQHAFDFAINPENTTKWVSSLTEEQTNETPTKLGTIYRNKDKNGKWREFVITGFAANRMFEMTEKDSNIHVRYTFSPFSDNACQLEYFVCIDNGELTDPFNETNVRAILQKLKTVIERL